MPINQQTINAAQIQVGRRVHNILYGGRDGTIVTIHGTPRPETVRNLGPMVAGGADRVDVVWDDGTESRRLPERLLQSVQWRLYDEVAPASEVMRLRRLAVDTAERKAREKVAAEEAFRAARAQLIDANPHLVPGDKAAANMRRALKLAFPGVKFSVRQRPGGYSTTITVSWDGGPEGDAVRAIVCRHKAGNFDGMTDCYEYSRSPFADAFGSAEYVFTHRGGYLV